MMTKNDNSFCNDHKYMVEATMEIKEEIKEIRWELRNIGSMLAERNGILKGIRISVKSLAALFAALMGYYGIKTDYVDAIIKNIF